MTQQNAALVEESAAAAESLREQASRLAQVVQIFRIDGAAPLHSPAPLQRAGAAHPPALKPAIVTPARADAKPVIVSQRPTAPPKAKPMASHAPAPAPVKAPVAAGAEGDWESF
jgi:methyl-accepting chemotaxis protein